MNLSIQYSEEVDAAFEKLRKKEIRYAIFKTNGDQSLLELENTGDRDTTFDQFKEQMPKAEPRWAIYDLHFSKDDGSTADKLVFFHYSPDDYFGQLKFFFATAKETVANHFVGINKTMQINDWEDFDEKETIEIFL